MLNVVVLNGGRGAASIIPALLRHRGLNVTSIVNAYDDGKSTGAIRHFFQMLGPSDIRKVQELMLPEDDPHFTTYKALFQYRYPVRTDRGAILEDMSRFGAGGLAVAGIRIEAGHIRRPLQRFVSEFVKSLAIIERVRGAEFTFEDCSLMNCIYAGAFLATGRNIDTATRYLDRMFRLKGTVIPNSLENKTLAAVRENGEILYSEAEIVELRSNVRLDRIYLVDRPADRSILERLSLGDQRYYLERHHSFVEASPAARLALEQADILIYAAGTQHSSLYPTYMSRGLAEAIVENTAALKVLVTNIGADYETPSYTTADYILGAYRYLCLPSGIQYPIKDLFDYAMINTSRHKADETYVDHDGATFESLGLPCVEREFEDASSPGKHDGARIVSTVPELYEETGLSTL